MVVSTGVTAGEGLKNSLYTRNGNFKLDAAGNLVNTGGMKVMGATYYNDKTGEAKTIENYSSAIWCRQDCLRVPTPRTQQRRFA